MTILVFKTSVTSKKQVKKLRPILNVLLQKQDSYNFDLEDCDRILRVKMKEPKANTILKALHDNGFLGEELV